jgi:uncharacterized Rossmann fold enzyme
MDFDTWEPVYEAILEDMGYDRAGDEAARDDLVGALAGTDPSTAAALDLEGKAVAIVAPGPSLPEDLPAVEAADAVVAVSDAADHLHDRAIAVDCHVTDLDKVPETAMGLTQAGVPVAVHAHGDNRPAIQRWVPQMDPAWVIPTTQAAPRAPVRNYGGFTDGDRAAFLADHAGAARLTFPGWDLEDDRVGTEKRRKLDWAARLLHWLEVRRGETVALLDGRRGALDTTDLPI